MRVNKKCVRVSRWALVCALITLTLFMTVNVSARRRMTEKQYRREARRRGLSVRERYWLERNSRGRRTEEKLDSADRAQGGSHQEFRDAVRNPTAPAPDHPMEITNPPAPRVQASTNFFSITNSTRKAEQ